MMKDVTCTSSQSWWIAVYFQVEIGLQWDFSISDCTMNKFKGRIKMKSQVFTRKHPPQTQVWQESSATVQQFLMAKRMLKEMSISEITPSLFCIKSNIITDRFLAQLIFF